MRKIALVLFFVLVVINLFLASWFVIHNDINFTTEIARDFFILQEIDQKKIVLIGPSSSTGLFHGPLWAYVNYPAYVIGKGDPIVVGWFWILLIIAFLVGNYFIAKNLFNKTTAYIFVLMTSLYMVFHANGFFNPHGAMLLLPAFFYFFVRYLKTRKLTFLVIHIFIAGAIIQFQMAVGIPLFLLSFIYCLWIGVKEKKLKPLAIFLLIVIPLSTFIVFDLRHEFILSKITLHYAVSPARDKPDYLLLIGERVRAMVAGTEIFRQNADYRNLLAAAVFLFLLIVQIKDRKYKNIYQIFLYFYIGFFFLSLFNTGPLLYFYQFPIFPLAFLIFSSFITSRFKKSFIVIFMIVYLTNLSAVLQDIKESKNFIGKSIYSWNALSRIASEVYKDKSEFGYFVYSPNVVAFEGKYAMWYMGRKTGKTAYYFQKKPVTYLIIAPPPPNNPFMKDEWWTVHQLKIAAKPVSSMDFENRYKIEKYQLTEGEIAVPFDSAIDPGLHFR